MGSPGWLKHESEMFHALPKNVFSNGVSQATRQNLSRPILPTGSLVVQNLSNDLYSNHSKQLTEPISQI
jgi:hypothetical protein